MCEFVLPATLGLDEHSTYLCLSQNVSVLDGEALCGAEGVLGVLWKSGGYLHRKEEEHFI